MMLIDGSKFQIWKGNLVIIYTINSWFNDVIISSSMFGDVLGFVWFEHDPGHYIEGHEESNGNEEVKLLFRFQAIMNVDCRLKNKTLGGLN